MNINRHNYETFFILYIDNELSVQEKNAVDVFVHQNPDLKQELVMFQQSILQEEPVAFTDKNSLLKPLPVTDELQEKLLLLLDNELDKSAVKNITATIKQDAACKQEWDILQQTKISADNHIVFEDKASLYKKEQNGRVVAFRWWRVAAAALFIGFGIGGAAVYFKSNSNAVIETVATNQPQPGNIKNVTTPGNIKAEAPLINQDTAAAIKNEATAINNGLKNNVNTIKKVIVPIAKISSQNNVLVQRAERKNEKPSNHLPQPSFENLNNNLRNNTAIANVTIQEAQPNKNNILNETTADKNTYASNASFADDKQDGNSISYGFDDNEAETKKTKMGSFLKKAKRVLQRKTNIQTTGDNNFKVANLSFSIQ